MKKIQKAKNLAEARRVCRPSPLKGEELDSFFVETDEGRVPDMNTRQRLTQALEAKEDARLLFYGHRGSGKSTELNKLLVEQSENFFAVTFSVHEEMTPLAVRAEDLILIICNCLLKRASEAELRIDDKILEPVLEYFNETVKTESKLKNGAASVKAGASAGIGLVGLLKLFTTLSSEIKLSAHSKETTVARLRKRPADLVAQANNIIEAVRNGLPEKQRLLIVVEDLDKLNLAQAYEIYVKHSGMLTELNTNIIYTIPVFLLHSPDAEAFKHYFDDVVPLQMINVANRKDSEAAGTKIVKKIIYRRLQSNLIDVKATKLLIRKTGGVLRHLFEVIHVATLMTGVKAPLGVREINYGLTQLRKEFWKQITPPLRDGQPDPDVTTEELYDRLAEYGIKQEKGEKIPPKSDYINQILLKSCGLVEYNGSGWFGVHPLVMDNLGELGRLS